MKLFSFKFLICFFFFPFCSADALQNLKLSSVEHGKQLYEAHCVSCHGISGDGQGVAAKAIQNPKPMNFRLGYFRHGSSVQQVMNTITKGVPGTAMPPWREFSESEKKDLVEYLFLFSKQK